MQIGDHSVTFGPIRPEAISRFRKERFILSMSEEQFRDEVLRPLFLRRGLKDGRDLCGMDEEGKDTIFVGEELLGYKVVYAIQTKKGNINLTRKANESLIEAKTQLLTALQTPVVFTATKENVLPTYAILAASGKINSRARTFIVENLKQPHIRFIDIDDLIPEIDKVFPELWLGIDSDIFPYLKRLKNILTFGAEEYALLDLSGSGAGISAISDDMFVKLYLNRPTFKVVKKEGVVTREPKLEEFPATSLLKRKERHFLILGEAGSGKSTILRRLAYVMAEDAMASGEQINLPILLRAPDISRSHEKLLDICTAQTSKLTLSNTPAFTVNDLRKGNVTIFIDALDEVPDDDRRKVIERVLSFRQLYPLCKIVLTSRDYSFIQEIEELRSFASFRLSPIDWRQTTSIIKKLHHGKKLKKEMLQEYLRRLQNVHGIELNPLLVTVFVATSDYSRKDIPANITELFKKYTEMMLGRWDLTKGINQQYLAPLKDFLLKKLAFEMHRRKLTRISETECTEIFAEELKSRGRSADVELLLEEIYRSGLFRFINHSIEFRHHLLQEFFAGRGIPNTELLQTLVSDPWWQRSILFHFGERPDDHQSLESVIRDFTSITSEELFNASIAVGLALQACYLVKMTHKMKIYKWVIDHLSESRRLYVGEPRGEPLKFPLMRFLGYYIFGREAVACDVLEKNCQAILEELKQENLFPEEKEIRQFWTIVGLVECGLLETAFEQLKNFNPADDRLYLALFLGCLLVAELRVFERSKKDVAKNICDYLASKIPHLRKQIIEELKTELLEAREGEIRRINDVDQ